ncbi:MAG: LPXTG cell wall anchor domain-containing protein [Gemella sp.]|nr:MAG: LPXTG cell wall anchor domain-containing protein [Gemella sp.]
MTDGIPGAGKQEDDDNLFNEKEHGESARYANAAVHLKESFKGKYDIYPIGFLNFGEEAKKDEEFAKRLLEKLATKKVYTSDKIDELEKVFENVAKDVIKKFDFELGHKLVAKTPEKLVYKLTETVLNPNESDLTKIQTELKLLNQGKVIAPTSVQTIDVISKQGRAVFEWLIELNRKDFKETDKLNFEVITSTSEKLKAAKKAYFNIDNKVTKYEVDRSKIEEIIKDEIEKGKVNVKEILLKELENEAKSEPSESKKGEPLIQPENPKYEIPTDKNIEEPKVGTIAKENTHKENLPPKENTVTFKSNEKENVKASVLLDSKENKVIAKKTKTLPNTGTSSQSTAIIGLISAALALRLRKKAE